MIILIQMMNKMSAEIKQNQVSPNIILQLLDLTHHQLGKDNKLKGRVNINIAIL